MWRLYCIFFHEYNIKWNSYQYAILCQITSFAARKGGFCRLRDCIGASAPANCPGQPAGAPTITLWTCDPVTWSAAGGLATRNMRKGTLSPFRDCAIIPWVESFRNTDDRNLQCHMTDQTTCCVWQHATARRARYWTCVIACRGNIFALLRTGRCRAKLTNRFARL